MSPFMKNIKSFPFFCRMEEIFKFSQSLDADLYFYLCFHFPNETTYNTLFSSKLLVKKWYSHHYPFIKSPQEVIKYTDTMLVM